MIVGTAGHIDHGKTTLVRALTGVDTDRLPEERKRGISIELGYAFLELSGGGRVGFVDVPGHERLVHTMLSGATGIDFALLLVAADDGPMPQTREHAAVLSLLGVARGAVVVTKTDRVDDARVAEVAAQAGELLAGCALPPWPVLAASAQTGAGLDALRALLADAHAATPAHRNAGAAFRLAIDRVFAIDGVGTVATGTAHGGRVALGDELVSTPGGRRLRVRGLHAQNRAVEQAGAGQRCALVLAGADRATLGRGQWLVAPEAVLDTDRVDVELSAWTGEERAIRSGQPVHVHLGSTSVTGTVAILEPDALAPGASGFAQLVLRERVGAWHGDRVVLRDASARRTIAGGRVLDPFAPVRYRRTPQRLDELRALCEPSPGERLRRLVGLAAHGVDLRRRRAADARDADDALPGDVLRATEPDADWALGAAQAGALAERVRASLAAHHAAHPDELGPDPSRLRRLAAPRLAEPLWRAALARLRAEGAIALQGACVHLPEHGVQLSEAERRLAERALPRMDEDGFEGSWVRDLARDCGAGETQARVTLARLARRGELHQVVKDLYYSPATMARLAGIARGCAAGSGEVTAAGFRDATGLGRKRAIQVLEYLDRIGVLRRVGDVHRVRSDSLLFVGESA